MADITLLNSDCLTAMKNIDESSVDLILTDPPYNLGRFMEKRATNLHRMRDNFFGAAGWDDMEFDEWEKSMDSFFESAARIMKKGGSMIVFMAIISRRPLPVLQCEGDLPEADGVQPGDGPV